MEIVMKRTITENQKSIGELVITQIGLRRYTWTFDDQVVDETAYPTVDSADWAAGFWAGEQGWPVGPPTGTRALTPAKGDRINLNGQPWTVTKCSAAWYPDKPETAYVNAKSATGTKSKFEKESLRWDGRVWQVAA